MKRKTKQALKASPVYERIRQILESARTNVARSVNTTQVVANWLIGREIVEEEQKGVRKAGYGDQLLAELSARLVEGYGRGYSATNLRWFRQLFLCYPDLVPPSIQHSVRDELEGKALLQLQGIHHALRDEFDETSEISEAARRKLEIAPTQEKQSNQHALRVESSVAVTLPAIGHAVRDQLWISGQLHPNLSWNHYHRGAGHIKTGGRE
jgi:hypothetical protein